jgi:hypothetical protein
MQLLVTGMALRQKEPWMEVEEENTAPMSYVPRLRGLNMPFVTKKPIGCLEALPLHARGAQYVFFDRPTIYYFALDDKSPLYDSRKRLAASLIL